jgi:IS5 family transposase
VYIWKDQRGLGKKLVHALIGCASQQQLERIYPIQRSSMTHWQKRVGESFFEKLLQESLRIAFVSKALKTIQLNCIVVDITVQAKAVAFPTDVGLMRKAISSLVDLAKKNNIVLRQTYERVVKRAAIKSGRYRHAKQIKRAKQEGQFIRTRLGRVICDISRKIHGNDALQAICTSHPLKALRLQKQQHHSKEKVYFWHAPETECIGKGKAHKSYEFGCKYR